MEQIPPKPPEHAESVFSGLKNKLSGIVVDTITTRFLLLFLFMLVIPLAAALIFTVPRLAQTLDEVAEDQLAASQDSLHWALAQDRERLALANPANCGKPLVCLPAPKAEPGPPEREAFAVHGTTLFQVWAGKPGQWLALPVDQSLLDRIYHYQSNLDTEIWVLAEPFNPQVPVWLARSENSGDPKIAAALLNEMEEGVFEGTRTLKMEKQEFDVRQDVLYGAAHQRVGRVIHVLPRTRQQLQMENYYLGICLITFSSLLFSVVLAMLAGRTITQPLLKLIVQVNTLSRVSVMKNEVTVRGVHEITQLSEAFNRMIQRLQQEQKMKDEFVATLTHDLKVPMIAEKQTLSYFKQQAYGPLNEEQQEVLDVLQSSNQSCLSLVNGMLEVYRYNAGGVVLVQETFSLARLLEETIQEVQSLALEKSILLEVTMDVADDGEASLIFADRLEIKRVLHNVVSNAITNTPNRGKITCRLTDAERYGNDTVYKVSSFQSTTLKAPIRLDDRLMVVVQDSGLGFSSEDFPMLFKQFAASKGRNPMSIGLGLFNSYQVVVAHNGILWVESTEGEGSTVSFVLPKNKDAAQDRRVHADRRKTS